MTRLLYAVTVTAACTMTPNAPTEMTPAVVVTLPSALGTGVTTTSYAPSTPPAHPHSTGVPPLSSTPGPSQTVPITAALPVSYDLSSGAPPTGDQGNTSSCQSWASGYSLMSWWANHLGVANARFAPMSVYSQISNGSCATPLWAEPALEVLESRGIDTTSDFEPMQQLTDCATQPADFQRENAARFKITGHTSWDLSNGPRLAIEAAIASGRPALLGLLAYNEFEDANATSYVVGAPQPGDTFYSGHVVAAFAYDATGVWILNEWGATWGRNGWALLSWDFIEGSFGGEPDVLHVDTIDGVAMSCSDSDATCAARATAGECQTDPDDMLAACCASCANPDLAYRTYAVHSSVSAGRCLDVTRDGTADGTRLDDWTCNATPAQAFTLTSRGHGVVQLFHPHGASCVDVYWGGTSDGTPIDVFGCNGTDAQAFTTVEHGDGTIEIANRASGSCLDIANGSAAKGTPVQLWHCNGTPAQSWRLVATP